MLTTLPFHETVRSRYSSRGYLSKQIPDEVIREVLEEAQRSPSNCNTQPWSTHIVSGAKRDELSEALLRACNAGQFSPDFSFDQAEYFGPYKLRNNQLGKCYYGALGIGRDDQEARQAAVLLNLHFFQAPHVAMMFMPSFGDNVRVASDVGMYGQTFLLSLAARGLAGIPQTMLGMFADTTREVLGVSKEWKLLFGISFGYPDEQAPANSFRSGRDPISECVTFHR